MARLVADGLTNRPVADRLFLSPHTVDSHVRHAFAKLGVSSRVDLTRLALASDRATADHDRLLRVPRRRHAGGGCWCPPGRVEEGILQTDQQATDPLHRFMAQSRAECVRTADPHHQAEAGECLERRDKPARRRR